MRPMGIHLSVAVERFPLASPFVISRGAKVEAVVIVATLTQEGARGRGEAVPYARYGESVDSVLAQIELVRPAIEAGTDRIALQKLLPPGAARNALDCAFWDLEAKRQGVPAYALAGLARPAPATTAFTISLGTAQEMAATAARATSCYPLLKLKLSGVGDAERLAAVRAVAPAANLIVDANEAWSERDLESNLKACARYGVALVEQPLPSGRDALLGEIDHYVAICADESLHDRRDLLGLKGRYDAVNIKLDKAGGLTEALALTEAAENLSFTIMVGCMVASSLAMAPALLLGPRAKYIDLDGPLLLAKDRPEGLLYEGSCIHPPTPALWG